MSKAIFYTGPGGSEVLAWRDCAVTALGPGEALVRQTVVGLNYIDVYERTGLYPLPHYPTIPGKEAAGVVEAVGEGCTLVKPGMRVAYGTARGGAYAQRRVIAETLLVPLPEGIRDERAAAIMLKGLTAHYLLRRTFVVNQHHTILVQAAAGGVGLILVQWAKALGARVIGVVGSEEKAAKVKDAGCDHVFLQRDDWVAGAREITEGRGVNAAYDSVGKDTFYKSVDTLTEFGMMVSYGQSSGPIAPLDVALLGQKGSLFLTRPSLMHYKSNSIELRLGAEELFDFVLNHKIKVHIGQSYYLADAAQAQRDLEARATVGSTILIAQ